MTRKTTRDNAARTNSSNGSIESESDIHSELTGFQRDLLLEAARFYDVEGHYPRGIALQSRLEEYYRQDVTHGRTYPNLDTLAEVGLIEKVERDRRTNEYQITDAGWEALAARRGRIADAVPGGGEQ